MNIYLFNSLIIFKIIINYHFEVTQRFFINYSKKYKILR